MRKHKETVLDNVSGGLYTGRKRKSMHVLRGNLPRLLKGYRNSGDTMG